MTENTRRRVKSWLTCALAVALFYLIVDYVRTHPDMLQALAKLKIEHLLLVLLLDLLFIALYAWRTFFVAARFSHHSFRYLPWLRIYTLGQILNFFAFQSGDIYRAYTARSRFGLDYANYAAAFLLISWLDMLLIFILAAGLGLAVSFSSNSGELSPHTLPILVVLWLALAPLATLLLRGLTIIRFLPQRLRHQIHTMLRGFWGVGFDLRTVAWLTASAVACYTAMTLMILVIFMALGANIALYQAALLLAAYKLSHAVLITPGNIGVREWSVSGVSLLLGLDPGIGLLCALIMRAVHLLALGLIIGAYALPRMAGAVRRYGRVAQK